MVYGAFALRVCVCVVPLAPLTFAIDFMAPRLVPWPCAFGWCVCVCLTVYLPAIEI